MSPLKRSRIGTICLPGSGICASAVLIVGIIWGPIAAALVAVVAVPALVLALVLCVLVVYKHAPASKAHALLLGFGLYGVAVLVVISLLSAFGPTQIM